MQFADDTISMNPRDDRVITVPLVWCPRLLEATLRSARTGKSPAAATESIGPKPTRFA
jgi:hypothetical protein